MGGPDRYDGLDELGGPEPALRAALTRIAGLGTGPPPVASAGLAAFLEAPGPTQPTAVVGRAGTAPVSRHRRALLMRAGAMTAVHAVLGAKSAAFAVGLAATVAASLHFAAPTPVSPMDTPGGAPARATDGGGAGSSTPVGPTLPGDRAAESSGGGVAEATDPAAGPGAGGSSPLDREPMQPVPGPPGPAQPHQDGPDTDGPDTGGPDTEEPDMEEPDTEEPDTEEPDSGGPDSGGPDSDEPDPDEPDPDEPDTDEPEAEESDGADATPEDGSTDVTDDAVRSGAAGTGHPGELDEGPLAGE